MCVVSMVSDHYMNKWGQSGGTTTINTPDYGLSGMFSPPITRQEFDELKKEVLEMKALIKRAKEYDERTGQPDCHLEQKVAMLKKIADVVGVNLDDVFKVAKE